jgi:hypothetical protein
LKQNYTWQKRKAQVPVPQRLTEACFTVWSSFIKWWYSLPLAISLVLLWKDPRVAVSAAIIVAALSMSILYPFFFLHYYAAYVCILWFVVLRGFMLISNWTFRTRPIGKTVLAFLITGAIVSQMMAIQHVVDHWHGINPHSFRGQIAADFARIGGQHVFFVRYNPGHSFHDEWVYNDADIDSSAIVWCRYMGPEDIEVARYFKGRRLWIADVNKDSAVIAPYMPTDDTRPRLVTSALRK